MIGQTLEVEKHGEVETREEWRDFVGKVLELIVEYFVRKELIG